MNSARRRGFGRDAVCLFENYAGRDLHRNCGRIFRGVFALRARLRETLILWKTSFSESFPSRSAVI
jgi:hypothetical protein